MLTAIIVDDEPYSCETLSVLLYRYCPDVQVLAVCNSGAEALQKYRHCSPGSYLWILKCRT